MSIQFKSQISSQSTDCIKGTNQPQLNVTSFTVGHGTAAVTT